MSHATFGIAAAAISLLGYPIYALEFFGPGISPIRSRLFRLLGLHGGTKPRVVSWGIWAALQVVIYSGARAQGASDTNLLPLAYFAGCVAITAIAARHGEREIGRFDLACGTLALASLALLIFAQNPREALALAILTDTLAGLPTLVAVAKNPAAESLAGWVCFLAGALLNVLAFPSLDPGTWTFEVVGYTLVVLAQQAFVVARICLWRHARAS